MTLRIRVLGDVALESEGRPLPVPTSAKAQALLVWLALNPGPHPRSRVAPLLWPEVLDESARASLRTAAWALRQSLGDAAGALETTRETIGLADGVVVDARELASLVATDRLEAAAELAHADLAPGLEEEWLDELRETHRGALGRVYERLAQRAQDNGDLVASVLWTRRQMWLDPLAEGVVRDLVMRLGAAGDRAGALRAFSRFRSRLRAELGLQPSAETVAAVDAIRATEIAARELPARLAAVAGEAFVGRGTELESLLAAWERAGSARVPHVVALAGEPGIGKTRLIAELARTVQAAGRRVVYGAAAAEALVPYQPVVEALEESVRTAPEVESDDAEPTGARRYRLFERFATLAGELADPPAVVIALDDLQWADVSTTQLVRHLARSPRAAGVLLVLSYRPGGVGSGAVSDLLMDLNRELPLQRITLAGLDERELADLLRAWGVDALDHHAQVLHDRTDGNPFFVRELVREAGDGDGSLTAVPESVREVVHRRIARLDESAQALVAAGAVAGSVFDVALANAVVDAPMPARSLPSVVDALVGAGVVDETEAYGELRFGHALVRDAVYENLSRVRRTALHLALAAQLTRQHGSAPGPQLAVIAHHYRSAGSMLEIDWTIAAAEWAFGQLAFDQAMRLYGRSIATIPPGDDRRPALVRRRAMASQLLAHALIDAQSSGRRA